uniref:Uncharacterized protein n=1 Tax=Noctiluca scintillans TaxID=2966 RepID=A0A7S1A2U5_NOCSC
MMDGQTSGSRSRDVVLSVFMEGTANPMDEVTTQIALFARLCDAKELPFEPEASFSRAPPSGHFKLCFEGCGVSHGVRGTLFAHGLQEQCRVVRQYLDIFREARIPVQLNFVGLSRGGIGGLYLAQSADLDPREVVINLLLFDPVPGNFIWMARVDYLGVMNASSSMDVSHVRNLGRVVVLYPHQPLPSIAVHAPLLPIFPEGLKVERDVILGCHQGALWLRARSDTCLAFVYIRDFLLDCGTRLTTDRTSRSLDVSVDSLCSLLNEELGKDEPTSRSGHAPGGEVIMRYARGKFLNRYHEKISQGVPTHPDAEHTYMLDFERSSWSSLFWS